MVDVQAINPDFKYLKVTRSGGIGGFVDEVHVSADMLARVSGMTVGTREFELDARQSEDLLHSVNKLIETKPGDAVSRGADMYQYDIELAYNGNVYRVTCQGLATDEALHGVIMAASNLMNPIDEMSLRSVPHADAVLVPAGDSPAVGGPSVGDEEPVPMPSPQNPNDLLPIVPVPGAPTK